MATPVQRVFGEAQAKLVRARRPGIADVMLLAAVPAAVFAVVRQAQAWTGALRPAVDIELSLRALPGYAALSLGRGLAAYVLSLAFTLVYGYWAAKDRVAERVLIPLLDILQSIPVLGFMPGLVLALVALFPAQQRRPRAGRGPDDLHRPGLEHDLQLLSLAAVGPSDLREAATVYRFNWWQRFKWVELPFATIGLVWNSMMSMAGGWFFLMISEAFRPRRQGLPPAGPRLVHERGRREGRRARDGVGRARHGADDRRARPAALAAGRRLGAEVPRRGRRPVRGDGVLVPRPAPPLAPAGWLLRWLGRASRRGGPRLRRLVLRRARRAGAAGEVATTWCVLARPSPAAGRVALGAAGLLGLLRPVSAAAWLSIGGAALLTLVRVMAATALGTLWALPAGLAIGLSPRLSRVLQPVVQVAASFPAPMLFPAVVAALAAAGVGLGWGSIVLMLLGTQWYILFNVIAGAMAIPADLREAARLYRFGALQRFRVLYLPAVFPYLVTGWVTAAGGAWNASIVAEYVSLRGAVHTTAGLGARISLAAAAGDFPTLGAAVVVMALVVVFFNRTVWHRLHRLAGERFSLAR